MKHKSDISFSNSARLSVEGRAEPLVQTALDLYLQEITTTKEDSEVKGSRVPSCSKKEVES